MQFNSYSYLVLLVPVVAGYWALAARFRTAYVMALSLLFYALWKPAYVAVPLAVCAAVHVCGRNIIAGDAERKRQWMWRGIVFVVFLLCFFKYGQFLSGGRMALAMPLGISFFSFEAIGFLIDARQGRVKSVSRSDAVLFLMFWPNSISGP